MAFRIDAIPMTVSDLQDHSPTASLFTCHFSYSCEVVGKISADIVRRAVSLLYVAELLVFHTRNVSTALRAVLCRCTFREFCRLNRQVVLSSCHTLQPSAAWYSPFPRSSSEQSPRRRVSNVIQRTTILESPYWRSHRPL